MASEIKLYSAACIVGGTLRIVSSFLNYEAAPEIIELIYIATDLCLILGLLGFYATHRQNLSGTGHWGFAISICGLAFIAGPETSLFETSVYQIGSPVIGLGLLLFSVNLIRARLCSPVAPVSLIASVGFGLIAIFTASNPIYIVTGVLFGVGFIGLGIHNWQGR